jgi:hypothetical protein
MDPLRFWRGPERGLLNWSESISCEVTACTNIRIQYLSEHFETNACSIAGHICASLCIKRGMRFADKLLFFQYCTLTTTLTYDRVTNASTEFLAVS